MWLRASLLFILSASILGLAEPSSAALQCTPEITGQTSVTRSGYRFNRRAKQFVQTVTITNTGNSQIQGPINLVLEGLPSGITLGNAAGSAGCTSTPAPYAQADAGNDTIFSPGEKISVALRFENPGMKAITYTPHIFGSTSTLTPISGININPDAFLIGQTASVTIRALVPYSPGAAAPAVTLERLNADDSVQSVEGEMVDDGNLSAGDEIMEDGVFSMRRSYTSTTPERIRLRIRAVVAGTTTQSPVFFLDALKPITDQQLSAIISLQQSAENNYKTILATSGKNAAIATTLQMLKANPLVLESGLSDSGNSIWILFKDGIPGGLLLNEEGTRGAVSGPDSSVPLVVSAAAASSNQEVGNQKVAILSPFLWDFGATDEGSSLNALYRAETCPKYDITYLTDAAVTVSTMKQLNNYGVIHISTHGDTYFKGLTGSWADFFGWFGGGSQVVFLTGEQATAANKPANQVDLLKGRLAIISGYYGILPSFIATYGGQYPDSLVFLASCRSHFNTSMSDAFLGKGARTFLGYSEYVDSGFAFNRAVDFHTKWIKDPASLVTTGECFTPGLNDGGSPPASWIMSGASDLALPSGNQLQNGSFETGTLGAWNPSGDGRVVTQLGTFGPTAGNFMGIISTGLGFTTDAGSISQKVCIPADAKELTFKWNFNSEEFREWCGSQYQDYFQVSVATASGSTILFNRTVDDLCGGTAAVPFWFDQGGVWSYGWQTTGIDISGIAAANVGKPVTITFSSGDVGDSFYDTAVLIDEIAVTK